MIAYTARAAAQVHDLYTHFEQAERPEAARNLARALADAERRIEADPMAGRPAPPPYPGLARPGQAWIKAHAYWIRYAQQAPSTITAVLYDRANIPARTDP